MIRVFAVGALASVLGSCCGCEKHSTDPPLPAPKFEIVPAPPGALGAKAAGTDAAPPPPEEEPNPWPSEEEEYPPGHPSPTKPRDAGPRSSPPADAGGLPL